MPTPTYPFDSNDNLQIWEAIMAITPGTGDASAANQVIQINELLADSLQDSVFKTAFDKSAFVSNSGDSAFFNSGGDSIAEILDSINAKNLADTYSTAQHLSHIYDRLDQVREAITKGLILTSGTHTGYVYDVTAADATLATVVAELVGKEQGLIATNAGAGRTILHINSGVVTSIGGLTFQGWVTMTFTT